MKTHELKCWSEYFLAILCGLKTFEFRLNDRNFEVGDILLLKEWNPINELYTGREISVVAIYVLTSHPIPEGYAAMSIKRIAGDIQIWENENNREDAIRELRIIEAQRLMHETDRLKEQIEKNEKEIRKRIWR